MASKYKKQYKWIKRRITMRILKGIKYQKTDELLRSSRVINCARLYGRSDNIFVFRPRGRLSSLT